MPIADSRYHRGREVLQTPKENSPRESLFDSLLLLSLPSRGLLRPKSKLGTREGKAAGGEPATAEETEEEELKGDKEEKEQEV